MGVIGFRSGVLIAIVIIALVILVPTVILPALSPTKTGTSGPENPWMGQDADTIDRDTEHTTSRPPGP